MTTAKPRRWLSITASITASTTLCKRRSWLGSPRRVAPWPCCSNHRDRRESGSLHSTSRRASTDCSPSPAPGT
eukprot:15615418-Heterocapsa_arctica.AAC.1